MITCFTLFRNTSAVALTLLIGGYATAKVAFTDIQPDTMISASESQHEASYELDLNGDNTVDFVIEHLNLGVDDRDVEINNPANGTGQIFVDNSDVPLLTYQNYVIDSNRKHWKTTPSDSPFLITPSVSSIGVKDQYIGLRVMVSGHWYYGWLHISVPGDISGIILKGYAFEQVPDQGIRAGSTIGLSARPIFPEIARGYPNPVSGQAYTLELPSFYFGGTVEVVAISGEIIKKETIVSTVHRTDFGDVRAGIYLVRVVDGENRAVHVQRVMN